MENRSPGDGNWDSFTSMRVRAAIAAQLEGRVKVFIQLQDVRLFGEEGDTKGDYRADNFDLHQGYLELGDFPGGDVPGRLNLDLHHFQTAQEGSLSTQSLGNEIDFTLSRTLSAGST